MASMTKALCNNCLYPLEIARISDPTTLPVKARQKELHTKTMILVLRLDFIFVWPTMSIMTSSSLHPKSLSPPLPVFEFNPDGRMLPKVKCLPLASPAAPSVHPARPLPAPLPLWGEKSLPDWVVCSCCWHLLGSQSEEDDGVDGRKATTTGPVSQQGRHLFWVEGAATRLT